MPSMKIKDSLVLTNKTKRRSIPTPSTVKPLKLPPISTLSKEHREKWDIQALPSDWEVDTKPSKAVERLLQKRQRKHEQAIESMRKAMAELNSNIEDEIRMASTVYKRRLKISKKEMEKSLNNIRQILRGSADVSLNHFGKAIGDVSDIYKTTKHQLFILNQKLKEFEKQRSASFRMILKATYTKLNDISYKLPYEIEEYFEQEIQVINEITLNNMRAYAELKFVLKLQLGNEIRSWLEEIQYIKEYWLYYVKLMVFTNLNQSELFDKDCNQEVLQNQENIEAYDSSTCGYWQTETSIDTGKMFNWVNQIESTMHCIDTSAKTLVVNFKTAVMKVVYGYLDEMRNTAQRIYDLGLIRKSEISIVKSEFCGQAVMDVTNKYTNELSNVQTMWAHTKRELQDTLEQAFVFLNHFSEIWQFHLRRITVIKSTVLKDLQRSMTDGYLLVSGEEMKINILIDIARQECDPKRMSDLATDIFKALDNLKVVYKQNYQDECSTVETITDFLKMEGELLESELAYFLSCYYETETLENPLNDDGSMVTRDSVVSETFNTVSSDSIMSTDMLAARNLLSSEIRKCKLQIKLLHKWKIGLHSILSKYMQDCKDENASLAKQWICEEHFKAKMKFKLITQVLHEPRYKRIKPILYDLTLAELEEHINRFKEHKAGLDQEVSNACLIYPKYEMEYKKIVEKCEEDVENIKGRVLNAQNSATVTSALTTFDGTMSSYMNKIVKINELYETDFTSGISLIFNCNLRYLKAIKLFSEGGNFNSDKAREICDDLSKIEKSYKKKIAMVAGRNDRECLKCLQYLNLLKYETFELLYKYEDELKYYDNCIYKIKDVQTEIKNDVYQLKFKHKQIVSQVNNLWEIGEKSIGQPKNVESFVEHAKKLIPVIEEYRHLLERPATNTPVGRSFSKSSRLCIHATETTTSLETTIKKLQSTIKSTTIFPSMNFSDYSSFLFDVPPGKENSFIGKMRYLLYTSYKSLQQQGKIFYEKHLNADFVNTEKIHANYQDFVSETLPKYIYYYLQCELVWLEQAHAFIKLVDETMSNLRGHQNKSTRKYIDDSLKDLQEAFDSDLAELYNVKSQHKNQFSTLYKKLKPLHGYPGNKTILDALTMEVQAFFDSMNEGHTDLISLYKNNLNEKETNYVVGLYQINDNLEVLKTLYAENMFAHDITINFVDTILYLKKFVTLPPQSKSLDNVLTSAIKKLEYYKKTLIIPPEYLLNVSASSLLCNSPSNSSSNIIDDVIIDYEVEAYSKKIDEILVNIESVIEDNKRMVDYWKAMWDKAVDSVIDLYKVKYD